MSEGDLVQQESPLVTERGTTTIKDTVVSRIAGISANEVEGVHMGGGASRAAGGLLGSVTGSENQTRGVKVEVGRVETAIDLTMGIDYGKNILETVDEVRRRISDRVGSMTGLRITELNVTINDIVFPDGDEDGGSRQLTGAETGGEIEGEAQPEPAPEPRPEVRTMPSRELRPGARERESTPVEPRSRTHTEGSSGPVPDEEVRVEQRPLEEDETARLRIEDDRTQEIERGSVSEPRRSPTDSETGSSRGSSRGSGQGGSQGSSQGGESGGRSGSRRRRPRGDRGSRGGSGESGGRPEGS